MGRFAEINDLLDSVERSERKLKETTDQLKETEEKLKKAEDTLEERKLVDRAKGLLMDKADFSEQVLPLDSEDLHGPAHPEEASGYGHHRQVR